MAGWILATGREAEQELSQSAGAGATTLALAGADLLYAPGDLLFAGAGQWLGRATQATAAGVSFSRPLGEPLAAGARLWRAARWIEAPGAGQPPARRERSSGVLTERSVGGCFYAVRVAEPSETFTLELGGLTPAVERALVEWIGAALGGGLAPLALVEPGGGVLAVRLAGGALVRERGRGDRLTLRLPLILVAEGQYP